MHHTCTCIFKGPLDTSCFKKHFHFILLFMDHFLSNCEGSFSFFSYSTYYIFIEQFFVNRHIVYMYMYLRSIIHVYVLPCTPPCSLVMALTNIACQKWGTKIWALTTKEKMIEQRALTGNMN